MQLKNLKLTNFKNYDQLNVDFHDQLNIITGLNGSGKTNLIDAIYYLCSCKSYFISSDRAVVKHDRDFFTLEANFEKSDETYSLNCKYHPRKKKQFECNRKIYDKLAKHIGKFPLSIITPDDIQIVKAGSEFRRKLTDHTLSQIDYDYLLNLMRYNKVLQQRNAYLKQIQPPYPVMDALLDSYDLQLEQFSQKIYQLRTTVMESCIPSLQNSYAQIADNRETVSLTYRSNLQQGNFLSLLKSSREKDRILKRTTVGIHKDDWDFMIGEFPIKKLGSQGQQKSFLIALKLAYYQILKEEIGVLPLLLLDDIFDKLDSSRIKALLQIITTNQFGQIFITDADSKRLPTILDALNLQYKHFVVQNNELILQNDI